MVQTQDMMHLQLQSLILNLKYMLLLMLLLFIYIIKSIKQKVIYYIKDLS